MRILAVALVAVLSGCFAFEEMEAGQEILDRHYAGNRKEPPETRGREPLPEAGPLDELRARAGESAERLRRWWTDLRLPGGSSPEEDEQLVRCTLDGRTHFSRMDDCRARGGSAVPVDPPEKS